MLFLVFILWVWCVGDVDWRKSWVELKISFLLSLCQNLAWGKSLKGKRSSKFGLINVFNYVTNAWNDDVFGVY